MDSLTIFNRLKQNRLIKDFGIDNDSINNILQRWNEPHRHYHNLNHLFKLFDGIDEIENSHRIQDVDDMKEKLEVIALFHDVIYDPMSSSNEDDSADFFSRMVPDNGITLDIYKAILDTDYGKQREPTSEMSRIFRWLDWELPLYGSSFYDLLVAEKQLLRENQFVSYDVYKKKRVEFIEFAMEQASDDANLEGLLELKVWVDNHRPKIGVYAGSFNPFHIGHLNVLEQAERVFDKVIILSARNDKKSKDKSFGDINYSLPFHEIVITDGLTTEYLKTVREYADVTLVRGLRNGYDLQYESNLRRFMEEIGEVDVMYFLSGAVYQHISSSDIRGLYDLDQKAYHTYIPTKYDYHRK